MASRNDILANFAIALGEGPDSIESSWDKGAIAVLDANVMLDVYELKRVAIDELQRAFEELVEKKRLAVPRQAYLEFLFNRPRKVAELHKQMSAQRSRLSEIIHPLATQAAIFPSLQSVLESLRPALGDYQTKLGETLSEIASWAWDDPISRMYRRVLAPIVHTPAATSPVPILDSKARTELEIPPGYKDKQKAHNADGDFEIWKSLISVGHEKQADVVFITNESKGDWIVKGSDGLFMPRYELLVEFRQLTSRNFYILPFDKFLNLIGAKPETVSEVRRVRSRRAPVVSTSRLLNESERLVKQIRQLAERSERKISNEIARYASHGSPDKDFRKHATKLEDLSMEIMAEYDRDYRAKVELVHSELMNQLDESEPVFDLPVAASSPGELRSIADVLESISDMLEEVNTRKSGFH